MRLIAPNLYIRSIDLTTLPRPMIVFIKESTIQKPLIGAEIGVASGVNAQSIMETLSMKKLFLIDPYEPYVEKEGVVTDFSKDELKAYERMRAYQDRVEFIKKHSDEAVGDLPDNLDFIYIDGNHSYEHVRRDIENYCPKIRSGGVIGGHDFVGYYTGLCIAVVEFAQSNGFHLMSDKADWWVVLPQEPEFV